ncbi:MAG: RHS repeat-associated core domain-containing protein [Bacteroidales bacterium]|nr:RHS repeat-associated core domain-containing protein [Candidatus Colimorpha pelethequi]
MFNRHPISSTLIGSRPTFSPSKPARKQGGNGLKIGVTFTGKETDCETGFSYFGARYYDPTILTSWTAVDPMSDDYPNMSPYHYCHWNPIRLTDPTGMCDDEWKVASNGEISHVNNNGGKQTQYITFSDNSIVTFTGEGYHKILSDLSHSRRRARVIPLDNGTNNPKQAVSRGFGIKYKQACLNLFFALADHSTSEWRMDILSNGEIGIGSYFTSDRSPCTSDIHPERCDNDVVKMIHSHPSDKTIEEFLTGIGVYGTHGYTTSDVKIAEKFTQMKYYVYAPNIGNNKGKLCLISSRNKRKSISNATFIEKW